VIVAHAGNGNETTTGRNGDIWSIFYSDDHVIAGTTPVNAVAALAGFTEGDVVPETETGGISSPLGVMCHEFGHSLGLPDLYNTTANGGSTVTGKWEIMDSGPYLGPAGGAPGGVGSKPAHMSGWDKLTLGWVTPTVITTKANTSLTYVETNASLLKLPIQSGGAQEYFLVEYRSRSSGATFDTHIPGDGLLIWHVDDAITSSRGINASSPADQNTVNTGSPHYGVSVPNGEGHTTLQMQLTRPAGEYSFNIYTLSGDLVRKIGKDEITLNTDRSLDYKWVYEYAWDLTNGDGKMVAPGVYLYLARADGETKTNKAVIIR
jgi:hypothetical protein